MLPWSSWPLPGPPLWLFHVLFELPQATIDLQSSYEECTCILVCLLLGRLACLTSTVLASRMYCRSCTAFAIQEFGPGNSTYAIAEAKEKRASYDIDCFVMLVAQLLLISTEVSA